MTARGLPRQFDTTRPVDAFDTMVLGGIERLTDRLRRGDPVSAQACADIERIIARLSALKAAYEHRTSLIDDGRDA